MDRAFVAYPWLAYLHIAPGVVYLLGVPLQLACRFCSRHYRAHRRLGRDPPFRGLLSGLFAIVFGVLFPYGGPGEVAATVVFGAWLLSCLVSAVRAIRRDDVVRHRRRMIGARHRNWRGYDPDLGSCGCGARHEDSFTVAFWISFLAHTAAPEW